MPETQGHHPLPGILSRIVRTKRQEVKELRSRRSTLEAALGNQSPPRDFGAALGGGDSVSLIAECKRRSPGAGSIRPELDPAELAQGYEQAGASAISVLTDHSYFGGSLSDLRAARDSVSIPVLRKDFTLDPLQVIEARASGADAVLLIARILDDASLRLLYDEATSMELGVLVEVHDARELERALQIGVEIVGINNRDLATFTTELETTLRLLEDLPDTVVVVSESGIRSRDDVERLGAAGVDAILVGESLLSVEDPAEAARSLVGVGRGERRRG